MPTLTDLMVAELTRPDVAARVPAQARETWQAFHRLLLQIGGALMRVAQSPPSPGYEPYFVERGADALAPMASPTCWSTQESGGRGTIDGADR